MAEPPHARLTHSNDWGERAPAMRLPQAGLGCCGRVKKWSDTNQSRHSRICLVQVALPGRLARRGGNPSGQHRRRLVPLRDTPASVHLEKLPWPLPCG